MSGTGFGGLPTIGNRTISTTIRLKDGETNMLAGLIRDDERGSLSGVPGLSDVPLIGRLFASNHKETQQTDVILTITPHIVRVLDVTEADLRPFRLDRDAAAAAGGEPLTPSMPREELPPGPSAVPPPQPAPAAPPATPFPQPLQGALPGVAQPVTPPATPKKPGGGGGGS